MEMRCCRKILCISCMDHVTNVEVRIRIQHAIRRHGDLLTSAVKMVDLHGTYAHFDDLDIDARSQWLGRGKKSTLNSLDN